MIGYVTVGSNNLPKATQFYDALVSSIGGQPMMDHGSGGRIYTLPGGCMLAVVGPFDGKPATVGNGCMVGLHMESRDAVDRLHAKALELGGTDEGAPGPRGPEGSAVYMAYFRDLDGNKFAAMKMG